MIQALPEGDWIQGHIRQPAASLFVSTYLVACACARDGEAPLPPCQLSHVNDTRLRGILSLFVLLPPQGPSLAPISF